MKFYDLWQGYLEDADNLDWLNTEDLFLIEEEQKYLIGYHLSSWRDDEKYSAHDDKRLVMTGAFEDGYVPLKSTNKALMEKIIEEFRRTNTISIINTSNYENWFLWLGRSALYHFFPFSPSGLDNQISLTYHVVSLALSLANYGELKGPSKFIGSAEERIKEDYLRILRYFRFFIEYSKTDYDKNTIKYIKQNINGLNKVSNERIFIELKKILSLQNVNKLFLNTQSKEIILNIFPQFKFYERLNKIENLEEKLKINYDSDLILALLIIDQSNNYEYFCHKYKTSNNMRNRFKNISKHFEEIKNKSFFSEKNIKRSVYFLDKKYVKDLLFFSICLNNKIEISKIKKLIGFINNFKIPKFPISGDELKNKYGYESGELLGKKLKDLEKKWIENNFFIDDKEVEKSLNKFN